MAFVYGVYTAKENIRVRCGVSSIGLGIGAKVEATQFDAESKKVLVKFGGKDTDWMSLIMFNHVFEQV